MQDRRWGRGVGLVVVLALLAGALSAAPSAARAGAAPTDAGGVSHVDDWLWVRALFGWQHDAGHDVAVDRFGNSYVTGVSREGGLAEATREPGTSGGDDEGFLAKYDRAGRRQWLLTISTPEQGVDTQGDGLQEAGLGVAVDDAGGVYVTGITDGTLPGSSEVGPGAFIAKYSSAGERLWVHELGPQTGPGDGRPRPAAGSGIAVDRDGNVIVTGITHVTLPGVSESPSGNVDLFITKYDSNGGRLWIHQLAMPDTDFGVGGSNDWTDVTVDRSGNAFVTGNLLRAWDAGHSFPTAHDAFVASYDTSGGLRWVRELASNEGEGGNGIAVDEMGGVYVTGITYGTLPGSQPSNDGSLEMFIAKYSSTGAPQWVRQYGAPYSGISYGIDIDRSRNLYLVGFGHGTGSGQGDGDVAVAKFDRTGTPLWARYIGSTAPFETDVGYAIALDPSGNAVVTGTTGEDTVLVGTPDGPIGGYRNIFVAKLNAHGPADR